MTNPPQLILVANVLFVLVVGYFINRMLRAASKFNWNPGDSDVQTKQKFIILKSILIVAAVALLAAIVNAFLG